MSLRPNTSMVGGVNAPAPRVIPAQVNFLTIYNPTLGDTEETEKDQIVFWAGKDELGTNRPGRRPSKDADIDAEHHQRKRSLTQDQILNERLRQIGLARGMVEFARNFSSGQSLDTIETDRSRIILHELETDWWILASIDLTRLPSSTSAIKNDDDASKAAKTQHEYSTREVSPATLLRAQLIKAHNLFLIHHASNLWELYNRSGRFQFCSLLNRFWEVFARRWDVLLHGNPAIDVYGDCVRLAGGGELGVGVGEEEWGSGEREVLEGFLERADGLVECIVGRYGAPPTEKYRKKLDEQKTKRLNVEEKVKLGQEMDNRPWLGSGDDAAPADGVVFSGVGTISRKSLATVSQWMEAIFKYGDSAYGIGENPASRPRQKRKRPKVTRKVSDEPSKGMKEEQRDTDGQARLRSPKSKAPDLRRQAIENNAAPPGIPAPLVGAVERSLDEALVKATQRNASNSPKSSPGREKTESEAVNGTSEGKDDSSSVFSMGGMKSILTLGYGSSWTLNPNGFEKKDEAKDIKSGKGGPNSQTPKQNDPISDTETPAAAVDKPPLTRSKSAGSRPAEERLQELDPTPEVSDEDMPFVQKLEQSMGKFLIGLSGDLENTEFEYSDDQTDPGAENRNSSSQRIFLRTLTVELANAHYQRPGLNRADRKLSQASDVSRKSAASSGSTKSQRGPEPKTSAAASVDGAISTNKRYEKVQVAVYVHQPFIFVFMFELHTATLTMPGFYRSIHHHLGPLQKPLLQRTDPARITERITTTLSEKASAAVSAVKKQIDSHGHAIYDLVHDPSKNTVRTSIPNIPVPIAPDPSTKVPATVSGAWYTLGIPIGTSNPPSSARPYANRARVEPWTRVEALNVHTQILNTFVATRDPRELERTVKTAKGWWVLSMKISVPGKESEELKEAFLVRKSADHVATGRGKDGSPGKRSDAGSPSGRWLLRDQGRDASGSSARSAGTIGGARGVSEGVGIDARKWVEGLLSLTQ